MNYITGRVDAGGVAIVLSPRLGAGRPDASIPSGAELRLGHSFAAMKWWLEVKAGEEPHPLSRTV
jgi:hypothetical protein